MTLPYVVNDYATMRSAYSECVVKCIVGWECWSFNLPHVTSMSVIILWTKRLCFPIFKIRIIHITKKVPMFTHSYDVPMF
jgi:hypothetical protein